MSTEFVFNECVCLPLVKCRNPEIRLPLNFGSFAPAFLTFEKLAHDPKIAGGALEHNSNPRDGRTETPQQSGRGRPRTSRGSNVVRCPRRY